MTSPVQTWLPSLIDRVERSPLTVGRWFLLLASIIAVRHFLEQISGQLKTIYFLSYFIHYPLAYVAPLIALTIVLALMSRERIERVTRLMLFAWLLTLLPPLVDLLVSGAAEQAELIGYLIPEQGQLGTAFLNLLNPLYAGFQGTTTGIRVEAAAGCVLAAVYVHMKTKSLGRALLTLPIVYVTMFFFFTLPSITTAVTRFFGADVENVYELFFARATVYRAFPNVTPFALSDLSNSLIDLIVLVPLLKLWYLIYDRGRFMRTALGIDWGPVVYHMLATVAGVVLGAQVLLAPRGIDAFAHPFDVISVIGLVAASFFTAWTASLVRRLFDREQGFSIVDAMQESVVPDPSTAQGIADEERTTLLRHCTFGLTFAALFSLSVSYVALTYVLATLAVYTLMYAPPFRLGRITPIAALGAGGITLLSVGLGYCAYAGENAALWLPKSVTAICLIGPALAFLARDVWEEGRRGATTISVTGRGGRMAAGVGVLLACLVPAAALRMPLLAVPGTVLGIIGLLLLLKGRPRMLPGALAGLAGVLVVAVFLMGGARAPVIDSDLSSTSYAQATRRTGTFELMEKGDATEQQSLVNEGIMMLRGGNFQGAIENFRRAIEIDPEYTQAYVSLGSAQLRVEDLEGAERSFRRALDIDPENVLALVGLAQTYKLFGQSDEAIEYLERALAVDPESVDAAYTLALIYRDDVEIEKEYEALLRVVEIDPRHSLAQSRLADILLANEQYERAISALRAALAGRMPVEHVHTRLADAYYSLGNIEEAERELRKEITLRPRSASPRANLARLLSETGRTEEAIEELRAAISIATDEQLRTLLERELSRLESLE